MLHRSTVAQGRLDTGGWYCLTVQTAALSPQLRAQARSVRRAAGFANLSMFPAQQDPDPLTVLVAWPPAEVVARRLERAYQAWQAAQPGAEPGP